MQIYYLSFFWLSSIDYSELDAVLRVQKIKTNRNGKSARKCRRKTPMEKISWHLLSYKKLFTWNKVVL